MTWGHSRGVTPLVAFSQRFNELNPEVEVVWHKRTLQQFADYPIEKLTEEYDLLIIDHPWVGCAAATECVLPLEQYLPDEYLQNQLEHSTGYSHQSYQYNNHQWALAIDAATPVASYRPDLFTTACVSLPETWEDVLKLANEGRVAVPAIPIDLLMNFYSFCIALGAGPFQTEEEVIDLTTGTAALKTMFDLYSLVDKKMFGFNPIAVAEAMTTTDDYWYCPFAYGYSNYSRNGYAAKLLLYTDLVKHNGKRLRSTIGGTGLAVSAFSLHKQLAVEYAKQVVSAMCQSTFYLEHGGQPAHRSAWVNKNANILCNNYFTSVLPAMENGYVRPRYNGYLHFQDHAGLPIQQYLMNGGNETDVLAQINTYYHDSLKRNYSKQPS